MKTQKITQKILAPLLSLFFLGFPIAVLFHIASTPFEHIIGWGLLLIFAGIYLGNFVVIGKHPKRSSATIVPLIYGSLLLFLPISALAWIFGVEMFTTFPYFVALWMFLAPLTVAMGVSLVLSVFFVGLIIMISPDSWPVAISPMIGVFAIYCAGIADIVGTKHQERKTQLTVEKEQSRIARDLHDSLGQTLTTINLKTQLVSAFLDSDAQKAREELENIKELTSTALAQLRSTVTRLKTPGLSGELEDLKVLFSHCDIQLQLPEKSTADQRYDILFGWVLREASTNILRHAKASTVTVRVTEKTLEIIDDGVGIAKATDGHGILGIKERVAESGGVVSITNATDHPRRPGTRVFVDMSGASN
ncbi:sensor histidine kinase [Rothia sp. P7208]|uniref:sensor histidine kinase n=1 Tax=Rothia sp. P7208 TaxID=3402660 RepID=UPI003ACB7675